MGDAEAEDSQAQPAGKPSAVTRFLWAGGSCFVLLELLVLFTSPQAEWLMGLFGAALFGFFSGLIAMCIPVRNKAGFIFPAIVICFLIAYFLGGPEEDRPPDALPAVER